LLYRDIVAAKGIAVKPLLAKYLQGEQQERAEVLIHHLLSKHGEDAIREIEMGKD
jgi:hypothetical protein